MSCKTYKVLLHSYINNELSIEEKVELEKHLQECPECRRELEEIRQLKQIISTSKPDIIPLIDIKKNIMAAIKVTIKRRAITYDIKVLGRLGASLIACGILVLFLNFSLLGNNLEAHNNRVSLGVQDIEQKISQPFGALSRGLSDMSDKLMDLNGITFRLKQKVRGGM